MERAKAMSAYVFVAVGGGSVGLLAGGILTQALSWHWIFFVNVPIGIATMIAGSILLVDNVGLGIRQGVDWVGSILVTASVMVMIYAIVTASTYGWGSSHTLGFIGLALALMAAFAVLESRISNPIMPLRILKLRTLTGSGVIRGLLVIGMFSTFFIGALYFEHVQGYSPLKTGLAFLPQAVSMAAMSTGITAWLVGRFGNKPVMYPAMVSAFVGLLLFATAGAHAAYFPRIFFAFLLMGLGAGASFMPLLQIGMSEIPNEDAGLGSGIVNVSQQMAGAIGLAALGTIAANQSKSALAAGHDMLTALADGYRVSLLIAAGCVLLGLAAHTDPAAHQGVARGTGDARSPRTCRTPRPWSTSSCRATASYVAATSVQRPSALSDAMIASSTATCATPSANVAGCGPSTSLPAMRSPNVAARRV